MTEETWLEHHLYRKKMVKYVEKRKRSAAMWRYWRGKETYGYPSTLRAYVRAARRFIHLNGLEMTDVDFLNPERVELEYLTRRAKKVGMRVKRRLAVFREDYPGQPPEGFRHAGTLIHTHPPAKPRTIPAHYIGWFPHAASYSREGHKTRKESIHPRKRKAA